MYRYRKPQYITCNKFHRHTYTSTFEDPNQVEKQLSKAELPLEGIFFALNYLPWEFLSVKKLEIEKTKTTKHTTFKTDVIKNGLSFFDFQLFYK